MSLCKEISTGIVRAVVFLVLLALLFYFFYSIRIIFAYLAISAIVALMGRPLVNFLHSKLRVPLSVGAGITLLFLLSIMLGFVALFVSLVMNQPIGLGNIRNLHDLESTVHDQIMVLNDSVTQMDLGFLGNYVNDFILNLEMQNFSGFFSDSLSFLGALAMDLFGIFFVSFFFLRDKDLLNKIILNLVPDDIEDRVSEVLENIKSLLSRYFIGLFLQALVMFVIYLIILLSFGIDNAAIIAVICAFLNLIPYLGPILGAIVIGTLSLSDLYTQNGLVLDAICFKTLGYIMLCYALGQAWDNFVNQPQIYSKSVKSNPLEIFIVILMGGILFGLVGVMVAVPVYTVLRVFLKEFFSEFKVVKMITRGLN